VLILCTQIRQEKFNLFLKYKFLQTRKKMQFSKPDNESGDVQQRNTQNSYNAGSSTSSDGFIPQTVASSVGNYVKTKFSARFLY